MEDLTIIQESNLEQTLKHHNHLMRKGSNAGNMSEAGASSSLAARRKPLLFIEVDTNGAEAGGIERIEVFKGDDPR